MWSLCFTAIDENRPYELHLYVWFACLVIWKRFLKDSFLKILVIGDETWILYQNMYWKLTWSKDKRSSTVAKPGLHPKKVLFLVHLLELENLIYYELLPQDEIINSVNNYNQFDKLQTTIAEKRPELASRWSVIFYHINAKCSFTCISCKRKAVAVWLGYSITSSVFFRFCFIRLLLVSVIKKFFYDKQFQSINEIKTHLEEYFASKFQ